LKFLVGDKSKGNLKLKTKNPKLKTRNSKLKTRNLLSLRMLFSCFSKKFIEAGCDEAGRGCLAGPVVAAAVILPKRYRHEILNDSKQLTKAERDALRIDIERDAIAWAVAEVDHEEIDRINILNASFKAMHLA